MCQALSGCWDTESQGKGTLDSEEILYQGEMCPRENTAWEAEGRPGRCFGESCEEGVWMTTK